MKIEAPKPESVLIINKQNLARIKFNSFINGCVTASIVILIIHIISIIVFNKMYNYNL